ncbi:MAG: family 78 glycoside hydrolase catalytic domain [Marinilabilia sp.]
MYTPSFFSPRILLSIAAIFVMFSAFANLPETRVTDLRTEYKDNPVGIDVQNPRLFWKLESTQNNIMQTAYQVQVSLDAGFDDPDMIVWDSGWTHSDQSIQVLYEGNALESGQRYYWRVRVRDNQDNQTDWSKPAHWEMGLLDQSDWKAQWICAPWDDDTEPPRPAVMMRNEFSLKGEVESARMYASSLGLYEMEINGQRVGDQFFTPGWTSYGERVQYQTYDISGHLQEGDNAIGVILGDGWYRGDLGWDDQNNFYGETLSFLGQIHVEYKDGTSDVFISNSDWDVTTGPIKYSEIYDGEYYDARLEKENWSLVSYEDPEELDKAETMEVEGVDLVAPQAPPVRNTMELKPVDVIYTPEGDTVLDMGQNMVGYMRMTVDGPEGRKVTLRHAEVLDDDGNFYTDNLRGADQTNVYVLKGEGTETWEPRFTFQGFRYVAVDGYPGDTIDPSAFTGVVVHSDMEPTGHFDCSNSLINQLQHNTVWGQKGNFLDVPTDCPQRDERLGWTGDIQVFGNTANILMNTAGFLSRWLKDLEADQLENGAVPHVVPNVLSKDDTGAAGWGDAATTVPWSLYQSFGDKRVLKQQYESMKKWVGFMKKRASERGNPYLWTGDFHFGDWLSFSSNNSAYPGAYTHTDLIATAFFAHSSRIVLKTAELLGNEEDVQHYSQLHEKIKRAFQNEFLTPNGRLSSDTQTAYLLALRFDLLPENMREKASENLVRAVNERGHLTTGFLGTPHLNHVLSEFGHDEITYQLLMRKDYPSWLYPITKGATTIWERWDGIKPDHSFQNKGMNSFNHYAYGAIVEWLFKEVAGIDNDQPGYKKMVLRPSPGGDLSHARAFQNTLYGRVSSVWHFDGENFVWNIEIPANTTAKVVLPYADAGKVILNDAPLSERDDLDVVDQEEREVFIELGSGEYSFSYPAANFPDHARPDLSRDQVDLDMPIENNILADLLADSTSREILFQEIPELMESAWLSQVMGFTLKRAMASLPEDLRIPDDQFDEVCDRLEDENI